MAQRKTRTGIVSVSGWCLNCEKKWDARNALGLAALHHDKTGHEVQVEQTMVIAYGGSNRFAMKKEEAG